MRMVRAIRRAMGCYARQLPDMLRYALLTLVIHAMPLAPALFLVDRAYAPGAALCAVLFVLLILPMRQNAAAVLQEALHGGRIFDCTIVSFEDYGRKLARGLKQTLLVLLWAVPVLAATLWAAGLWFAEGVQGQTDAATIGRMVRNGMGSGDLVQGVAMVIAAYALLWVPVMIGCGFHSGSRHARALGMPGLMKGCRLGQIGVWLAAQLTLLPWLICTALLVAGYIPQVIAALKNFSFEGMASPTDLLWQIGAAGCVLLAPLLPLRDLIIAAYPAERYDEMRREA